MDSTQEHITISNIKDDLVLLKDGGAALVLQTSAVNFGLLSDREQLAIIDSFAQMLNSLSSPIQIVIQSRRLDISSYMNLLTQAQQAQTNPLLSQMINNYRQFIQTTIKENEVLDKQFYLVIPMSYLELGLGLNNEEERLKKTKAILLPRKDQISRQLGRIGLKATQLTTVQLIKLFYNTYNFRDKSNDQIQQLPIQPVRLTAPRVQATPIPPSPPTPPTNNSSLAGASRNHPFVVEELMG